jgi:hypothetical protein
VLKQQSLSVVKMGDFELDMALLTSLVEVRPVEWGKTVGRYTRKRGTETKKKKKGMEMCLYLSSRRL